MIIADTVESLQVITGVLQCGSDNTVALTQLQRPGQSSDNPGPLVIRIEQFLAAVQADGLAGPA